MMNGQEHVKKKEWSAHEKVIAHRPMAEFLAQALGENYEVVLHDLSDGEDHVVALFNGHISGRGEDHLEKLQHPYLVKYFMQNQHKDYLVHYSNKSVDGRKLLSSTYFIKDEDRRLVGCICLNSDISVYLELKEQLDRLIACTGTPIVLQLDRDTEADMSSIAGDILEQTLSGLDVGAMRTEEKRNVIEQLNKRGVFLLRGFVEEVARRLEISVQTVYRYLKELD